MIGLTKRQAEAKCFKPSPLPCTMKIGDGYFIVEAGDPVRTGPTVRIRRVHLSLKAIASLANCPKREAA